MSKGYMRISRDKLSSWCWRGNLNKNYLMMFLLVNANFKSERFEKIIVDRGQYVFSYDGLSRDCGMPLQTLRTTLKDLVKTNQITIKSTHKWSLLTICEYDSWQIKDDETNTQVVTQMGTQVVTQMDNNIIIEEINKEIAELKKENNKLKEELANASEKKKKREGDKFDVRADLSYVDCFGDLWNEWLDYKDEIKKQYKTQRGAKSAFTEFKHLAGGDYGKAHAIIEQSFRRSWDGLFDVKDYVPNMFEQPTQVPQQTERALQKFCAFNVAFDTEKEADSFYDEQMRIRDGYYAGIYKAADRHAEDWIVQGNAVKLVDGVIYDYEQ